MRKGSQVQEPRRSGFLESLHVFLDFGTRRDGSRKVERAVCGSSARFRHWRGVLRDRLPIRHSHPRVLGRGYRIVIVHTLAANGRRAAR